MRREQVGLVSVGQTAAVGVGQTLCRLRDWGIFFVCFCDSRRDESNFAAEPVEVIKLSEEVAGLICHSAVVGGSV